MLEFLAEQKLEESLTLDTLKDTLLLANKHDCESLKVACFEWVRQNSVNAMFEPSIMSLAQEEATLWNELAEAVRGNKRQKTSNGN